jgi:multidrug efflux pump subunit AcrA (membrane-fusion protein)
MKLILSLLIVIISFTARAAEIEWKKLEEGPDFSSISISGRVVPQDGALNIESARVAGRIVSILKREGEAVTLGTPLYEISSAECFSLIEERKVAQSKNIAELIEGVERREKQLGLQIKGNDCIFTASHMGILTKRNLDSGSSFNSGDPLATVLDTRRLTVELDIPEKDLTRVKVGQKVQFYLPSNGDEKYTSKIQSVVPTIDSATRTFRVRLSAVSLPKTIALEALVFGDIDVGRGEKMLKAPSSAVVFHQDKRFVIGDTGKEKKLVQVYVISENENFSLLRPAHEGALKVGMPVACKGAIFLLKNLTGESVP